MITGNYIFLRGKGFIGKNWQSGRKDKTMKIDKLTINNKPVKGELNVRLWRDPEGNERIDLTINNKAKKKEKAKELEQFKNKWRIIILKHIGGLFKDIGDIVDVEEKELKIIPLYSDPCSEYITDHFIGVDSNPEHGITMDCLFAIFAEIDNLTGCDTEKMHYLVNRLRGFANTFKTPDKKPHIAFTAEEAWKMWQKLLNIQERR